jgi:hypothetical protein
VIVAHGLCQWQPNENEQPDETTLDMPLSNAKYVNQQTYLTRNHVDYFTMISTSSLTDNSIEEKQLKLEQQLDS